mmetsp:Transcript_11910/g.19835  ORF Transcript_11910/g.19835 Transcript_11910/m.19835 type:complete len:269 (-) Transcript_11910:601-1407(-)
MIGENAFKQRATALDRAALVLEFGEFRDDRQVLCGGQCRHGAVQQFTEAGNVALVDQETRVRQVDAQTADKLFAHGRVGRLCLARRAIGAIQLGHFQVHRFGVVLLHGASKRVGERRFRAVRQLEIEPGEPHVEARLLVLHRDRLERALDHASTRCDAAASRLKRDVRDPRVRTRRIGGNIALVRRFAVWRGVVVEQRLFASCNPLFATSCRRLFVDTCVGLVTLSFFVASFFTVLVAVIIIIIIITAAIIRIIITTIIRIIIIIAIA